MRKKMEKWEEELLEENMKRGEEYMRLEIEGIRGRKKIYLGIILILLLIIYILGRRVYNLEIELGSLENKTAFLKTRVWELEERWKNKNIGD